MPKRKPKKDDYVPDPYAGREKIIVSDLTGTRILYVPRREPVENSILFTKEELDQLKQHAYASIIQA